MQLNSHVPIRISALISIGAHPETGRPRRASTDARAVELALSMSGADLEVIHAGDPKNSALEHYTGMGLSKLKVLEQADNDDAIETFGHYFKDDMPDIILTGMRSEQGESSGMLPFFLAYKLQCPIVMGVAEILSIENGKAKILQALPRGQRRAVSVTLPFVASVDLSAPEPRQSAFGRVRFCEVKGEKGYGGESDDLVNQWSVSDAKPKPKRLKVVKAKSAADRFKAATAKAETNGGRVMKDQPVEEMAQAVFDLLLEEGVIR